MTDKERLKSLIDNPKKPNVSEWVYEVETLLDDIDDHNEEAWILMEHQYFALPGAVIQHTRLPSISYPF